MALGTAAAMPLPLVMSRLWDQLCPSCHRALGPPRGGTAPSPLSQGCVTGMAQQVPLETWSRTVSPDRQLCPGLKQPPVFSLKDLISNKSSPLPVTHSR